MSKILKILRAWGWMMLAILVSHCANIVAPSGGPRDAMPPVAIQIAPPNNSTSLQERSITVSFNEFVEVKDIRSELFVSPPMSSLPEVKIKGRKMIVLLPQDLHDSTTYTLSFGKAIRDITEGNILEDFTYSFSTGPNLDSLSVRGKVIDAFTGEGVSGALACLYADLSDTAFLSKPPYYIARTNQEGDFVLRNLAAGNYRLYAIKDMNSNFFFDQPNEEIAFLPDVIHPDINLSIVDTALNAQGDTAAKRHTLPSRNPLHVLRMFSDRDTAQVMLKAWLMKKQLILISFRNPIDSLTLGAQEIHPDSSWNILHLNPGRDTVFCWLTGDGRDSISLIISDVGKTLDTVTLSTKPRLEGRGPRREKAEVMSFKLMTNFKVQADAHRPVELMAPYPIESIEAERFMWTSQDDTLFPDYEIMEADPSRLRIMASSQPGEEYSLLVRDSAIMDMRGIFNDSIVFRYQMRVEEDYGRLKLSLLNLPSEPWFIELLDKDNRFLKRLNTVEEIDLIRILPGKYKLRIITDKNNNGRWDPGHFKGGIQAEPVYYFPGEIEVRAKWERVETWDLSISTH